jgi:hypothetical protein
VRFRTVLMVCLGWNRQKPTNRFLLTGWNHKPAKPEKTVNLVRDFSLVCFGRG